MKRTAHRGFLLYTLIAVLLLAGSAVSGQSNLDEYFTKPEHHRHMTLVVYRSTVSDTSSDWARVLLSGLIYAAASSEGEEMAAVGIREQDMMIRVYSVRITDLKAYIDEKISLNEFVCRIYMSKVPSQ